MSELTQQASKVLDLYKGYENERCIVQAEYGVCSECGCALRRHDVGSMHRDCEGSKFLGNNNDLFF